MIARLTAIEPIHRRRQPAQERAILVAAHAARVDGAHDERPRQSLLADCQGRASADDLGAVHVVVNDLRRPGAEQLDDFGQRRCVVLLVNDMTS